MTVFLAHAPANRDSAEALERFLERRGQFVELDDGRTAMPPVQASDTLVLLLTKDVANAPTRLRLEQRALDAWAEQRLIVVKLDASAAPVGLRDLPSIDATSETKRDEAWREIASDIAARTEGRPTPSDAASRPPPARAPARQRRTGVRGAAFALGLFLLALPGLAVAATLVSIWLVNRIGPRPGGWPELRAGVAALGSRFDIPPPVMEGASAAALVLAVVAIWVFMGRLFAKGRQKRRAEAVPAPAQESEAVNGVFICFAWANAATVMPVIEAAKQRGRVVWMDGKAEGGADGWAGEIARAIRGAADVVVMCSKAAFESDHVKREIYLADRYRKRLVPVLIEDAAPPEDFEYFFAGAQFLKLFETPEAERPQVLAAALGANA
ncbi:MAG: toll/interleukin-1 receptor domain-containing protein [Proteobacteria bacterium]|nr:toll/interleukin-1 receptor domain-containing protein [Pseudomonadota bacterium]